MVFDDAVATAERALDLSGSDPARARALARDVLRSVTADPAKATTDLSTTTTEQPEAPADLPTTTTTATDLPTTTTEQTGAPADLPPVTAALTKTTTDILTTAAGHIGATGPTAAGRADEAATVAHRALAVAARELGDLPLAEEHLNLAVSIALSAGLRHRAAQARLSLVHVSTELGHPWRALAVAEAAEPHLGPVEVAKLDVHRAVALVRLGRYAEAVDHCDRAAGLLEDDTRFLAGAMLNRGLARVFLGEFDTAESDLVRCAELAGSAGLDHLLALAEGNLPFLAARRGDLPAAFAAYRRAESSLFGYPERLATMRCDLAEALISAHLPGEARVLLDLAVPELAAAGAEVALAEARLLLARAELRTGDPHRALRSAERAAAGLAEQGRAVLVPLATEVLLRARLALGPWSGELLAETLSCADALDDAGHREVSEALRLTAAEVALEMGERESADDQLARLARGGPGVVSRHATALVRELAGDRRGAFAAVRAGLAEVGARAAAFEDPRLRAHAVKAGEPLAGFGLTLALRTGRAGTLLAWAERWRAVAGGAGRPVAPRVDELRAALRDTVLVEFARHGDELVAVAVTSERVTLRRLGSYAAVAEATVRLRYGLRRAHLRDGNAPGVAEEAALVERLLLAPLRSSVGDRALVVVPTGALHTLPWPVLPMNTDRQVSVASAAAAWLAGRRAAGVRTGRVVAVAGPGLRYAGAEADMVAGCHPGAERVVASRPAVISALRRAEVAHLAAHGTFCPRSPMLSGIDLDDGRLMAYDLPRLRTPPRLVVLSACEAGMAHAPADGAPLGLAGAFLSLGTQCVVASLVPVRDDETLTLMTAFHELLASGCSPAQALATASAKTEVAGFVCFGYGGRPLNPPTRPADPPVQPLERSAGGPGRLADRRWRPGGQPVATGRDGSATQLDQEPT
ncbi:CHAT domain-containing protein [Streptosporangium carneum]|uniref:CHAT domain-containing protein n=1 Tax=Streptosporangium carneum TaxID=47481 RepID=A0A9W6I5W8_9ACTN|nr:CHAT domain-containing tetratricopeptide repeat protein [Streptosporangium carneum]GLK12036.1 CHAT domain-containing protein [Streptosporangium carneum]